MVEIDYAARLINLYDPHSYKYTGRGRSLPLEMEGYIFVRAQVTASGGRPVNARLIVDTGSSVALSLTKQFSEAHKLLPPAEKLTVVPNCGIGGFAKDQSWAGTLAALQLGGFRLSNPVTLFYEEPDAQGYDGSLGGAALRNLRQSSITQRDG